MDFVRVWNGPRKEDIVVSVPDSPQRSPGQTPVETVHFSMSAHPTPLSGPGQGIKGSSFLRLLSSPPGLQCVGAKPLWQDTISKNPDAWLAHYNLGNAFARETRIEEAIACYFEAVKVKPDYPEAHNNLGALLTHQGKVSEGISHLAMALRLKPDNPRAHFNMGIALEHQGDLDKAIAHFSEALRIKPGYTRAFARLNRLLRLKKKSERRAARR